MDHAVTSARSNVSPCADDRAASAEREIAAFRRFEMLVREFLEVNAKICHTRPIKDGQLASQEKKRRRRLATKPSRL